MPCFATTGNRLIQTGPPIGSQRLANGEFHPCGCTLGRKNLFQLACSQGAKRRSWLSLATLQLLLPFVLYMNAVDEGEDAV